MQVIKYVGYARVSSKSQLDNNSFPNQVRDMTNFVGNHELVKVIQEQGSGANADRKGILEAIELCKANDYTLLISKVDRLSRELTLIETIRAAGIKFVFANMPNANELTIDMLLVFAKFEKKQIVERTNAGKKATIEKYGTLHHKKGTALNMTKEKQAEAVKQHTEKSKANSNNLKAYELISLYKNNGLSFSEITQNLNKLGFKTAKDKTFQIVQVQRIFNKYAN